MRKKAIYFIIPAILLGIFLWLSTLDSFTLFNKKYIISFEVPFKDLLTPFLGFVSIYLMSVISNQREKIRSIENKLSDKKYEMYSSLLEMFFETVYDKKSQEEIANKFKDVKKKIFLYAPDPILFKFIDWALENDEKPGNIETFKEFIDLVIKIRKDMGHAKTKVDIDSFMHFTMQSREEYKKFKDTYNW